LISLTAGLIRASGTAKSLLMAMIWEASEEYDRNEGFINPSSSRRTATYSQNILGRKLAVIGLVIIVLCYS
jgi:hypothetical protein